MPPRRSHKKSRAGCRRCKVRKIKCDEVHPRCGNCSKHGVSCDFEHPNIRDQHTPAPSSTTSTSTLRKTTAPAAADAPRTASASPSVSVSVASSVTYDDSPTNGVDATKPAAVAPSEGTPAPLYKTPDPPPLSSTTSKRNRMLELKLLHNFTTTTCKTLSVNSPVLERIWRVTVPELAFSSAGYLADTLLAVSALHLRSSSPHDRELIRASHSYMASACSEYGACLSKGVNENNADALFLTAALIAFQSTASRIFARDDINDRTGGYSLPLSWFHSFQGVKAVVAASWQFLCFSSIVIPIIESQPALNLNLSGDPTFFRDLIVGVDDEIAKLEPDPSTHMATRMAYQHAIAVLDWAHKIPYTGAPLVFMATVSRRFVELLEARRPRALAILASYFALLKCLGDVWWLKGVARREIMGIVSLFDPDDEEWWPRLQWPLRIALHDDIIIPPQVWGADWAAHSNQSGGGGGGFTTSHIELLSDMFSSMPQMNSATADLEPAHQYIVEQEGMIRDILLPEGLEILPVD
ncbi:hypothetical protein GGS20DRAFT_104795 [Poronia punctata]|nr:hypothetical protein GGS20DRAFT_104795 [Poronia punctata]